jgi:hypothetical protein
VAPGQDFCLEWGIGKAIGTHVKGPTHPEWTTGLTGYVTRQITNDGGPGATWSVKQRNQAFAMGPEIKCFAPSLRTFFSLRSQWEFGAQARTQGNLTTLTTTYMF